MDVRRACKNWLIANPPPLGESVKDWRDQTMPFGFGDETIRKQGNEHSLRGLAGEFSTRINVLVVMTSGHHIKQYNPPENIQHLQEVWLIYMDLENTRHYLSTIQDMALSIPPPPPPTTRGANGNSARARRTTGSSEPINDPALAVGSSSRVADSAPAMQTPSASQGASQDSQPIIEDIFEYSSCARRLRAPTNSKRGSQIPSADLQGGHPFNREATDCRIQRTSPTTVRKLTRNSQNASP
jgi:hypothetical protein